MTSTRTIIARKVRGSYRLERDAWPVAGRYLWAAVVKVDAAGYVRDRERLEYVSWQSVGVCELGQPDPGQVLELGYKSFRGARGRVEGAHGKGYVLIVQALYGADSAILSVRDYGADSLAARRDSEALCAELGCACPCVPEPGPRAKAKAARKAQRETSGGGAPAAPVVGAWGDCWASEGAFLDACYGAGGAA